MPKKSKPGDLVRRSAGNIPPATPEHMASLLAAMDGPIDTTEVPESKGKPARVRRDAAGQILRPALSPIRRAILSALACRSMTRYQLWAEARKRCPTLSQSAVYEYMRGQRAISSHYVEALLSAAGLVIGPKPTPRPGKPGRAPTKTTGKVPAKVRMR